MSLEQALSENTAAIQSLVAVWSKLVAQGTSINTQVEAGTATAVTAGPLTIPVAKPPKPVAAAVAPVVSAVKESPKEAASTPVATTASSTPSDEPPRYDQVAEAIRAMVVADRTKAVATLAQFGAKKGTELKAEQYADFMKALAS
jgi:hypothetical protein